jgi:alpha-beta hydrolase superfamily lysophospholipase
MALRGRIGKRIERVAAGAFDRAVVAAMEVRNARVRRRAESLSHSERMARLEEIRRAYDVDPSVYFAPPAAIDPALQRVRDLDGAGAVLDASWPSLYEPFHEPIRRAYLGHARNATAYARLFVGDAREKRPAVVLVHGYMAGQWGVEERAWPVDWLRARGLDVAIALLPFHALRGEPGRAAPPFPGADPRFTNEGFRQAMRDLRALVGFLRARGAPSVGVMGMSLGGYSASLLATVEPGLEFLVPIIPLASIADFARERGRLGTREEEREQHTALEAANAIVSPLRRAPLVPKERVLVVGGEADRITPLEHAERLARHFEARLVKMHGGHLLQFGRGQAFREVGKMLRGIGVMR